MLKRFAFVLVIAACGGGSKAAHQDTTTTAMTVTKSECAVMAEHVAGVVMTFESPPKASKDEVAEVIKTHCEADGWSADAKKCWGGIGSEDDAKKCAKVLTEAQHDSVMADAKQKFGGHGKGHHDDGMVGGQGEAPKGGGGPPPPDPESAPPPTVAKPPPPASRAPSPKAPSAPMRKKAPSKAPVKGDPCEGGE